MLRVVLSIAALAGVLAITHPIFANPVAAPASDYPQTIRQSVTLAPALSSPSDATGPTSIERGKDIPVGLGWG
jgi:hypothetical protein